VIELNLVYERKFVYIYSWSSIPQNNAQYDRVYAPAITHKQDILGFCGIACYKLNSSFSKTNMTS